MTNQMLDHPRGVAALAGDDLMSVESADVVEVPLLLSGRQMLALEDAAHRHGLTAGELLRHMLQDFIARALRGLP